MQLRPVLLARPSQVSLPALYNAAAYIFPQVHRVNAIPTLLSRNVTVHIDVLAIDDMPSAALPPKLNATEDATPQGLVVNLSYYDFEPQTPVGAVITKLPSKGTLYQTTGGAQGKTVRIDAVYNNYDLGTQILDQYLHKVTKVSSFWGSPPYAGYHALGILGAPDTNTYGEGRNNADWVTKVSMPLLRTAHALRRCLAADVTCAASFCHMCYTLGYPTMSLHCPAAGSLSCSGRA
jgi:hypothetical protein